VSSKHRKQKRAQRRTGRRSTRSITPAAGMNPQGQVVRAQVIATLPVPAAQPTTGTLAPRAVLDHHVRLHDLLARPTVGLVHRIRAGAIDAHEAADSEADIMFWPHTPHESDDEARAYMGELARGLFDAATFQVTGGMCDAVSGIYENLVGEANALVHIDQAELPAPAGFVWLDKPRHAKDKNGEVIATRVLTWHSDLSGVVESYHPDQVTPLLRICSWHLQGDADDYPDGHSDGPLVLNQSLTIPFGMRLPGGRNVDWEDPFGGDNSVTWFHALCVLMGTVIAAREPAPVERGARRRAQRSIRHDQVHVVTLRRAVHADGTEAGHRDVDWSCRWLVAGHHRHIEAYDEAHGWHHADPDRASKRCRVCGALTTFVHGYVKGPDGLPLRVRESRTLYRLAR